jgi:hypothetical protein
VRKKAIIDYIGGYRVPALRASRLINTIVATPLRAWLLHSGPSGLSQVTSLTRTVSNFVNTSLIFRIVDGYLSPSPSMPLAA